MTPDAAVRLRQLVEEWRAMKRPSWSVLSAVYWDGHLDAMVECAAELEAALGAVPASQTGHSVRDLVARLAWRVVQESSTDAHGRTDGPFYYVSQRDLDALEEALSRACPPEKGQ